MLVNPQAGLTKADSRGLERVLAGRGFVAEAGSPEELRRFVGEVYREGIGVVCVCGGDGTLGRLATALVGDPAPGDIPAIAPIGGGTMNTIARSLGLGTTMPAAALEQLLRGGTRVKRVARCTIRVDAEGAESRLGFMFGAGVPARFLRLYEQGDRLGALRAARVLVELVGSASIGGSAVRELFAPVAGEVAIDGVDTGLGRISMVYAAVIDDIGLGFRPTPRAPFESARFEILAADARPADLIKALPRLRFGDGIGGDPWVDVCAESAAVRLQDPMEYMIDGDVEPPVRKLRLSTGPSFELHLAAG